VAYDSSATSIPNWISSKFVYIDGSSVQVAAEQGKLLKVYKYEANLVNGSPTKVVLGGNRASGSVFPVGSNPVNYLVLVKKRMN
jgi:hypothetical protein